MQNVTFYTDGACLGNPGPGGFGTVVLRDNKVIEEKSGAYANTTNNRMEYRACIAALRWCVANGVGECALYTDSQYVMNSMTKWAAKWKRFGWYKGASKTVKNEVKNKDLVATLYNLCGRINVDWHWVKGHAGDTYNERADHLASTAAHRGPHQSDAPEDMENDAEQAALF